MRSIALALCLMACSGEAYDVPGDALPDGSLDSNPHQSGVGIFEDEVGTLSEGLRANCAGSTPMYGVNRLSPAFARCDILSSSSDCWFPANLAFPTTYNGFLANQVDTIDTAINTAVSYFESNLVGWQKNGVHFTNGHAGTGGTVVIQRKTLGGAPLDASAASVPLQRVVNLKCANLGATLVENFSGSARQCNKWTCEVDWDIISAWVAAAPSQPGVLAQTARFVAAACMSRGAGLGTQNAETAKMTAGTIFRTGGQGSTLQGQEIGWANTFIPGNLSLNCCPTSGSSCGIVN